MSLKLPDPKSAAQTEAKQIKNDPKRWVTGPVERIMADAPFVDRESLLAGLETFYRERLEKIPAHAKYPEAKPWVEHILAVDQELQAVTGMSTREMAIYRCLNPYLSFRGYLNAQPRLPEKCRVVYLPETDRGALHIKNIDDPITFWKPDPKPVENLPAGDKLVWDGVGSGLHLDDEPDEIFPLPVPGMCQAYCNEVPAAVEFLTRYSQFWGGQNIVLYDRQKRSVAIEKCSHNFIEVFGPDPSGGSHVSGMACRDPQSPLGKYQAAKRRRYLELFNQPEDGPDMAYWQGCTRAEKVLGDLMQKRGLTVDEVLALFTTPWPQGLNKDGARFHPDQGYMQYTLVTNAVLPDERTAYRWQRSAAGKYPANPEIYQF